MSVMRELATMGYWSPTGFNLNLALISLLLAFVLSQVSAWVYVYTHQGLSFSRAFVQSIVLLTIVVTLAMMVIGSNIVIAFGLIGALSVIRFRNILKDTRDTAFLFFSLIVGMACGTRVFHVAVLGTAVFNFLLLYLHWTSFGGRRTSDGFLRFNIQAGRTQLREVQELLHTYCRSTSLISQRFQESGAGQIGYRIIMRDPTRGDELVQDLQQLAGISNLTFVLHEEQTEV